MALATVVALLASSCVVNGSWTVLPAIDVGRPSGLRYTPQGASCAGDQFCLTAAIAFGGPSTPDYPGFKVWDGSSWTPIADPGPPSVGGFAPGQISCGTSSSCAVVYQYSDGDEVPVRFAIWNGSTWIDVPMVATSIDGESLSSCAGDGSCVFLDRYVGTVTFEGGAFHAFAPATHPVPPFAEHLWCQAADDCLAFEWDQTWHWDGDQWSVIAPGFAPAPVLGDSWADVDCTATNHCLAVGGHTTYEGNPLRAVRREPRAARFDGTTWTSTPVPSGSDHLRFVSCANAGACVAIGLGTDAFGWIGDRWLALPARPDFEARALSCEGHRCLAVGGDDLGDVASAVTYAWTD